jgi:hypothetical protein
VVHSGSQCFRSSLSASAFMIVCTLASLARIDSASADDLEPPTPAAFLPGGMLGVQLGSSWEMMKKTASLGQLTCQSIDDDANNFDEICFFRTAAASRVAGAAIHDGFVARKGDHVVLIGTGISIKNADDPLAESVVQNLQSQVHSAFQHTGDDVLFVSLPVKHMSAEELRGYSQKAPVLLVQLEPKGNELAVFYGYLAPVNAFGALVSD